MHPYIVAAKKDEAHTKVLEVVLKHSAKDELDVALADFLEAAVENLLDKR